MCALLLMGVVFASGGPIQFVSEKLAEDHMFIAQVLVSLTVESHRVLFTC